MLNSFQAQTLFHFFVFLSVISLLLYLPRIRYYRAGFKRPAHLQNPQKNRLAVIVPSKNEKGLKALLDSLSAQTYGRNLFDTYIVVAEDDDPNIALAAQYANTFTKVIRNQTCKAQALDGILKFLLKGGEKEYAGFIIVDADNIVDRNFVEEFNNALVSGRQIILGKRCVKNYLYPKEFRSWAVNCSALTYTFLDKLGNAFRSERNMPCTICGTGILIRRDVAEQMGGWPYHSMTEDFELTVVSLLRNWTTFFYEYAVTYTEEGLSHKSADARRQRWLTGFAQVDLKYRGLVREKFLHHIRDFLHGKRPQDAEAAAAARGNFWGCADYLYSLVPLLIYLVATAACVLIFGADSVYRFFTRGRLAGFELRYIARILLLVYTVLLAYTGIGMLADSRYVPITLREKILTLVVNPLFIAEYVKFYAAAYYQILVRKNFEEEWNQAERIQV